MREKYLFFYTTILFFLIMKSQAQDIIVKSNKEEIKAKVTDITQTEVKYKKFGKVGGPNYTLDKSEVIMIRYADGSVDTLTVEKTKEIQEVKSTSKSENKAFILNTRMPVERSHFSIGAGLGGPEEGFAANIEYADFLGAGYQFFTTYHKNQISSAGDVYNVYLYQHSLRIFLNMPFSLFGKKSYSYALWRPIGAEYVMMNFSYNIAGASTNETRKYSGFGADFTAIGVFIPFSKKANTAGLTLLFEPFNLTFVGDKEWEGRDYRSIIISLTF